jgi:hypothetical protein
LTEETLPLAELLAKAGDGDFLRSVAEAVVQLLMETDAEGLIGAGRHERSGDRTTYRNGYRDRSLDTRLGALQLRIPKLRQGQLFPSLPRAQKNVGEGPGRGDPGGVGQRRLDPAGSQRYSTTSPDATDGAPTQRGSMQQLTVDGLFQEVLSQALNRNALLPIPGLPQHNVVAPDLPRV